MISYQFNVLQYHSSIICFFHSFQTLAGTVFLWPLELDVDMQFTLSTKELMLLTCGVGEDSWESLELQENQTSQSQRRSVLNIHWKDWCWSWNSNTLATWCKELTHSKRPWCWERLKAGGEGDDRGWDGWMASSTRWTWVWASFGSWWWIGKPGVLQSMGLQRVRHNWATELNLGNEMWVEMVCVSCRQKHLITRLILCRTPFMFPGNHRCSDWVGITIILSVSAWLR